jgi:hypothetical protein
VGPRKRVSLCTGQANFENDCKKKQNPMIMDNVLYESMRNIGLPPALMVPTIASFREEACSSGHLQGDIPI